MSWTSLCELNELKEGEGLNAATGEYGDLIKAGVIDPTMVTRSALQNAASIAKNILTTEAIVAEVQDKDGGGGGGGMPDMSGLMLPLGTAECAWPQARAPLRPLNQRPHEDRGRGQPAAPRRGRHPGCSKALPAARADRGLAGDAHGRLRQPGRGGLAQDGGIALHQGRIAEMRFTRFFNNTPMAIASVDRQGRIGITFGPVVRAPLDRSVRTVAQVTYDETRVKTVAPLIDGWVDQLYVNFTGQAVRPGEPADAATDNERRQPPPIAAGHVHVPEACALDARHGVRPSARSRPCRA